MSTSLTLIEQDDAQGDPFGPDDWRRRYPESPPHELPEKEREA